MENMRWSYSFHATDKKDARAKIQAESANCPVTNIVGSMVDALPADGQLFVTCHGVMTPAEQPRTEELPDDPDNVPAKPIGDITVSVRLA